MAPLRFRHVRNAVGIGSMAYVSGVLYLGTATTVKTPLDNDDPVWTSQHYKRLNPHQNASMQDIITKRIPISKVKPELLQKEGDLVQEFCRGVWTGWGYTFQRAYLAQKYQSETPDQLWNVDQLAKSTYQPGTKFNDHFEVLDKTANEITIRGGDSPRRPELRDSDGLFIISAAVDEQKNEVVLGLKSCFFSGANPIDPPTGYMPRIMAELHRYYAQLMMVTAVRRLVR